jgi:hypothetical protein
VVVSTLLEAWSVVGSGLVKDGIVKDVSYFLSFLCPADDEFRFYTGCLLALTG